MASGGCGGSRMRPPRPEDDGEDKKNGRKPADFEWDIYDDDTQKAKVD